MMNLDQSFASHLCKYVGVGLISGSMVHAGTLGGSGLKYLILIAMGVLLFIVGVLLEGRQKEAFAQYLALSILVSIGTGMVSGSTQHFLDGPETAAILFSVGFWLAGVAFFLREASMKISLRRFAFTTLLALSLFFILNAVAHTWVSESAHSEGHAH